MNSDLDQGIEKNLDAALIQNKMHDSVNYAVKNGVVTLTGEVNSEDKRARAEKVAAGVPNVQQVVNDCSDQESESQFIAVGAAELIDAWGRKAAAALRNASIEQSSSREQTVMLNSKRRCHVVRALRDWVRYLDWRTDLRREPRCTCPRTGLWWARSYSWALGFCRE